MKKFAVAAVAALFGSVALPTLGATATASATNYTTCNGAAGPNPPGFNACGYNYGARIFSGPADGVDRVLDGAVWGDPTYASDHLVMKWNAQWDNCNANGYDSVQYCLGAWVTNEWNGMVPNGSKVTEHVKVIWVGSQGSDSPYWVPGGTSVWNNYEVIEDFGMQPGPNGHPTSYFSVQRPTNGGLG